MKRTTLVLSLLLFCSITFAQRGGSRTPSSVGRPASSSAPKSAPTSKPAPPPTSRGGSSSSVGASSSTAAKAPTLSSVDKATVSKAKTQGTLFNTRDQAVSKFQTDKASQYTSKFSAEPRVRPTYIPQTYRGYTVIYNPTYGGYGYMDPISHSWMMYNMMQDEAMMATMMTQDGYIAQEPAVVITGPSGHSIFLGFCIVVLVIAIIYAIFYFGNRSYRG